MINQTQFPTPSVKVNEKIIRDDCAMPSTEMITTVLVKNKSIKVKFEIELEWKIGWMEFKLESWYVDNPIAISNKNDDEFIPISLRLARKIITILEEKHRDEIFAFILKEIDEYEGDEYKSPYEFF